MSKFIRVDSEVYAEILKVKGQLEVKLGRVVSVGMAVKELLASQR